ncbi:MAG: gadC [Gammaproteobacteria bacterium]|jgi:amino acid transporter|nr:gadC [Gammaproteobacteria bacterium]
MHKDNSYISRFTLVLFIAGAVDSIRNLPTTALFGSSLVMYYCLAAATFLLPIALVSAELAASRVGTGIYEWVKSAFGAKTGFFAIWLQWINTMVWFPTILSFLAGTASYFINPTLATHNWFILSLILVTFWGLTLLNLRGIRLSTRAASWMALLGMVIPLALILLAGVWWLLTHRPSQVELSLGAFFPIGQQHGAFSSLTAIIAGFLGIELAGVHINHLKKPGEDYAKALAMAVPFVLITMTFGALTIAMILPQSHINIVNGVIEAFDNFLAVYHAQFLLPVVGIMILVGSIGGMISWVISPAKGLLQAGYDGFLPQFFRRTNKYQVPHRLLITQAILVSAISGAFLLFPSVNGGYWLLTALSTELYLLMYVLLLAAAIYIKWKQPQQIRSFQLGKGVGGTVTVAILGLIGCGIALVIGVIPPSDIPVGDPLRYALIFLSGLVLFVAPVVLFFQFQKRVLKKEQKPPSSVILPLI